MECTLQHMFANGMEAEVNELIATGKHCEAGDIRYLKLQQE